MVFWQAEEPGMEIYATNDFDGIYFPDRYHVDICINNEYYEEYFESKEECFKYIEEKTGCKNEDEIEKFNDTKNQYIFIHEYDIIQ